MSRPHPTPEQAALDALFARGQVALLTGAGISTASGIPAYRGVGAAVRTRPPVQYAEFVRSARARARYWRRSALGFPQVHGAEPNAAHRALALLAQAGLCRGLITQNVDGLHLRAGHPDHVELHGALREVVCLGCGAISARAALQPLLLAHMADAPVLPLADGDALLDDAFDAQPFPEITCVRCAGLLKPHVVFFGENVPRARVDTAMALLDDAAALVVLGSSLSVYSGLRFVHRAKQRGIPIAIATHGPTRGDADCHLKLDADVTAVVAGVLAALGI
jgi:NAD-dependent SIR2 family protein deacetylase